MATATLTKVGNSMAVLLPKVLRQKARISLGDKVAIDSPREGVIVITSRACRPQERLAALDAAEERIAARAQHLPPWPTDATADDLIAGGKEARAHGLVSF